MNIFELARKVKEMRRAQHAYFRVKTQGALQAAITLEKEVDEAVDSILAGHPAMLPGFDERR